MEIVASIPWPPDAGIELTDELAASAIGRGVVNRYGDEIGVIEDAYAGREGGALLVKCRVDSDRDGYVSVDVAELNILQAVFVPKMRVVGE